MPDKRLHRGAHPEDAESFSTAALPGLRLAVVDYSWLLTRGYAHASAIKLVGDRYQLTARQRIAVMRCSCSDDAVAERGRKELSAAAVEGRSLLLDGYNVLTTVEAALAGGVVLLGRDGCFRDLASMHGNFKMVLETEPALARVGETLAALRAGPITWFFDQPVSNSARLATVVRHLAMDRGWLWQVELVQDPDCVLEVAPGCIASADSAVLDRCQSWFGLAREVVRAYVASAWVVGLA